MSWSVSKSVNISEFPTEILIKELHNRVYDHLNDEEPQMDYTLGALPHYEKDSLRQALEECLEVDESDD